MIRFNCDYGEGAHPRILERLQETNFVQTPGYGEDRFCAEAAAMIREKCAAPEAAARWVRSVSMQFLSWGYSLINWSTVSTKMVAPPTTTSMGYGV